jgi:hypothetical protein
MDMSRFRMQRDVQLQGYDEGHEVFQAGELHCYVDGVEVSREVYDIAFETERIRQSVEGTKRPFVYLGLACGRWFLEVGGVVVAVETDPCRDMTTCGSLWGHKNLKSTYDRIQSGLEALLGKDTSA